MTGARRPPSPQMGTPSALFAMMEPLDDDPVAAAQAIHDAARELCGDGPIAVISLPHEPPQSPRYETGYMLADGTELWSRERTAAKAFQYRTSVTGALRKFYRVTVLSFYGRTTVNEIRVLFASRPSSAIPDGHGPHPHIGGQKPDDQEPRE